MLRILGLAAVVNASQSTSHFVSRKSLRLSVLSISSPSCRRPFSLALTMKFLMLLQFPFASGICLYASSGIPASPRRSSALSRVVKVAVYECLSESSRASRTLFAAIASSLASAGILPFAGGLMSMSISIGSTSVWSNVMVIPQFSMPSVWSFPIP